MEIIVIGAGLMGRAIAFDLCKYSNFDNITIVDKDKNALKITEKFLENEKINYDKINLNNTEKVQNLLKKNDIAISAIPYTFNYFLTKIAVENKTHFFDLGGNNTVVNQQKTLHKKAEKNNITIVPDCGLAPGLSSVVVRDIVETFGSAEFVKIRVGGLPLDPKPPLNYQIVFSPDGLINEYVEDAIALDHGEIITKKSMTELEKIMFPEPFGELEAFTTSGGCSTLPYTYRDKIDYLDYKTIRYSGHCKKFKPLLKIKPRKKLIEYLKKNLPYNKKDVVLMKILGKVKSNARLANLEYTMIDYYDETNKITSMMRTTAYPVSILSQLIERGLIKNSGVFCSEEIVPCEPFFEELEKRNIKINKEIR